ncbi:sacsin N-terminal ATP-binding-like domain-containing protein [Chloroflexota bacterium]
MGWVEKHRQALLDQFGSPLWNGYTNMLKTLESMFHSPKHWILEFLQNAEDAEATQFFIQLDATAIQVFNNGKVFTEEDFYTICDVNSRKLPSLGLRGYLGIGFKSIFRVTDCVEIHSGDFHFGFDKSYWSEYVANKGMSFSKWPWEILPVKKTPIVGYQEYGTMFYIPGRTAAAKSTFTEIEEYLTAREFPKEIILLVDNVRTVRIKASPVTFSITKVPGDTTNTATGKMQISSIQKRTEGEDQVSETHYLVFRTSVSVPEDVHQDPETERVRRSEISVREIGIIFQLGSDNEIIPLDSSLTGVYSFLPIEGEQTGLPFGIFGDFIPSPGRDQINYGATWNKWMCKEIEGFFERVVINDLLAHETWRLFASQTYDYLKLSSRGGLFWNINLRQPIIEFLSRTPVVLDSDGKPCDLDKFYVLSTEIIGIFEKEDLEKAFGLVSPHPSMLTLKTIASVFKTLGIYDVLHKKSLLETIKDKPEKLAMLYKQITHLSDYFIRGRPQGRGTRDVPLRRVPFILADDGQFYSPDETIVAADRKTLPSFLSQVLGEEKKSVCPQVGSNDEAVEQLKRCGVKVMDIDTIIRDVKDMIISVQSKEYDPQKTGQYDLSAEACIWLISRKANFAGKVLVSDGTLQLPQYVFVPKTYLDWYPLWQAGFLPGYFPINENYSKLARKYGLRNENLYQNLQETGIHGFEKETDARLITIAAEAISKKYLSDKGHNPEVVSDHDKLGYDLMCKEHCDRVFEVKGMADPTDVSLQASQVEKAKEFGKRYVLICVYNLPSDLAKIGFKEIADPQQIWTAEEKARVQKKRWLNS